MNHRLGALLFALTLQGAIFETAVLPTQPPRSQILGATDGLGNVLLVSTPPCSFYLSFSLLSPCGGPFLIVKLDANGKEILRRQIGDSSWRLSLSAVALDRAGRIVLGGSTGMLFPLATTVPTLPLVRPLRRDPPDPDEAYLLQLSPDAGQILFATYLGGNGPDTLTDLGVDDAGHIFAAIRTYSSDFPFTADESSSILIGRIIGKRAIVRIDPAVSQLTYALGLDLDFPSGRLSVARDGSVVTSLRSKVIELLPNGTPRRCLPVTLPTNARLEGAVPAPGGGFWITGVAPGGTLAVTPDAWQPAPATFSYLRWEGSQSLYPPGPIRETNVTLLAADRAEPNRIFAATSRGLARSENNGWTWEFVNGLRNISRLATSTGSPRLWLEANDGGRTTLSFSDDFGRTFRPLPLPPGLTEGSILFATSTAQVLHLAVNGTLYSTRDSGATWTHVSVPFPGRITSLAADSGHLAMIASFQFQRTGGPVTRLLYLSSDGGSTFPALELSGERGRDAWQEARGGGSTFPALQLFGDFSPILDLRFDPLQTGSLYLRLGDRLYRTQPAQFPQLEQLPPLPSRLALFDFQPDSGPAIIALDGQGQGHRSTDGGLTWQPLPTAASPPQHVSQLVVGAGGVVHLVTPGADEAFLGQLTATGELKYLSYLGILTSFSDPFTSRPLDLTVTPNGQLFVTGQTRSPATDLFSFFPNLDILTIAFRSNASWLSTVSLAGNSTDILWWAGPGPGSSLLLVGDTFSINLPGIPAPSEEDIFPLPTLFLARLRL